MIAILNRGVILVAILGAVVSHPIRSVAAELDASGTVSQMIQQHFQKARQRDGDHRATEAAAESARHAVTIAESGLGMKVSAAASAFYTDRTEAQPSSPLSSETSRQFTSSQATISARKPLYRLKDQLTVDQARARYLSAKALVDASEQRLFGRIVMAWIEILVSRDRVSSATESERRAHLIREEIERRMQAGESSVDQLGLEMSRHMARQADVYDANVRLKIAERALLDLAGGDAVVPETVSLQDTPLTPVPDQPETAVIARIEQENPELLSLRHLEDAARLEREKAIAEKRPSIEGYISVSKGENDTASYIRDEQRIGIQVVMPLYTSGLIDAAVAQAEAELQKAQATTWAALSRLQTSGVSSLAQLRLAQSRLVSSRFHLQATALHVKSTERGYLAGTSSRGELARAELEHLQARYRHGEFAVQYAQAWATLRVVTAMMISTPVLSSWTVPSVERPSFQPISLGPSLGNESSLLCESLFFLYPAGLPQCQ